MDCSGGRRWLWSLNLHVICPTACMRVRPVWSKRCVTVFSSAIEWRNLRRETGGNAKSALAIIGSNTLKGDARQLLISGEDEAEAFAALTAFMRDEFPHCDAPLPAAPTLDVQPVPESLSRLNPTLFHAHPVCAGSAGGTLVHLKSR